MNLKVNEHDSKSSFNPDIILLRKVLMSDLVQMYRLKKFIFENCQRPLLRRRRRRPWRTKRISLCTYLMSEMENAHYDNGIPDAHGFMFSVTKCL